MYEIPYRSDIIPHFFEKESVFLTNREILNLSIDLFQKSFFRFNFNSKL